MANLLSSEIPLWRKVVTVFLCSFVLMGSGCGGSDGAKGDTGEQGEPGEQGIPGNDGQAAPSAIPTEFLGQFSDAVISDDGVVTVNFLLTNDKGDSFIGLSQDNTRFTITKLFPEDATGPGDASKWQSYINEIEAAPTDPANGPGTEDKVQAISENSGMLIDNGDGSYQYVFNVNVLSVTTPVAVSYNAEYSHRVAMQISGGDYPTFNQTYTWQPSTGATDGIANRNIVIEGSCNNCHGELAMHGGGRTDTQYCVTCHNPGSIDANSGNTVDFKVMVHKVHRGEMLHEVINGGEYAIWGYRDSKHDYSDVVFPQDIRNCSNCHDEENTSTPQAANWYLQPTIASCSSCHDNIDFTISGTEPNGHPGGPQEDNALCSQCHGPNGGFPVKDNHEDILANQTIGAEKLVFTIDSATLDGSNNLAVGITMMLDGEPVMDYADIQPFIGGPGDGELMVNYDDGTGYQFAYSSAEGGFKPGTNGVHLSTCANNGAGKYTCTRADVAGASFGSSGTIALTFFEMPLCVNEKASNGVLIDCDTPENSTTRVVDKAFDAPRKFFNIDGSEATDYVELVAADRESCNGCHGDLSIHTDSHAAIDFNQCTSCHNATKVAWYGGRPGDLKSHVHSFHAAADSTSDHNLNSPYPGEISNCNACHSENQFDLPLTMNTRASKAQVPANADKGTSEVINYTSATVVVCSSCHIKVPVGYIDPTAAGYVNAGAPAEVSLSSEDQSLVTHMLTNGGVFNASTFAEANIVEACAVCHSSGSTVAVDEVHKIR